MDETYIKKLYVIKGKRNVGKTSTLKYLIDIYLKKPRTNVTLRSKNGKDLLVAFCYKGVQIGIATAGDTKTELKENFNFFNSLECAIAVTAWSVYSKSSASIFYKDHKEKYTPKVLKVKPDSGNFEEASRQKAEEIFFEIEELISKIRY